MRTYEKPDQTVNFSCIVGVRGLAIAGGGLGAVWGEVLRLLGLEGLGLNSSMKAFR